MKKLSFYLLIFFSVLAASCIKDRTNMNLTKVHPIVIDTTGIPSTFSLFQLDTLKIEPTVVKEGMDPTHLNYKWTMNAHPGYLRVIGTEKKLSGVVTEAPSSTPYVLILTVTDTTTNLKAFFTWNVSVIKRFGEGLVVADTKDGVNSDLNLIMAFNFTSNFSGEAIFRNLFSAANGTKISGVVKAVSHMSYTNDNFLTSLTDNSMIRVNPISYKLATRDNDNFIVAPGTIRPGDIQSVQNTNQHEYFINDGKVYNRFRGNIQFGYPFLFDNTGYECQKLCGLFAPPSNSGGALYDEKNNRFLMFPPQSNVSSPLIKYPPVDNASPAPAFDPNNLGNKTCLHMVEGNNKRVLAVMKTRDQPNYYVYQVIVATPLTGKMGYSVHDLSNDPEMALSKYYTCSSKENVLFYATDTRVYSSTLNVNGSTTSNLRYTVSGGEKITGMQMHMYGGRMYLPSKTAPNDYAQRQNVLAANQLLLLSTYNENTREGKIIAIPLETIGVGGLVTNPDYITTYSGFGKITAFNFQAP